jgi:hypothetical protein
MLRIGVKRKHSVAGSIISPIAPRFNCTKGFARPVDQAKQPQVSDSQESSVTLPEISTSVYFVWMQLT